MKQFSITQPTKEDTMVWQAALEFNNEFNIRHWTIYHDVSNDNFSATDIFSFCIKIMTIISKFQENDF